MSEMKLGEIFAMFVWFCHMILEDSLLNYSMRSVFGKFCFNLSFNVFVKLPIMMSE